MKLGTFRLDERVGQGAMGDVWRAEHIHNGHPAAVKVITSSHAYRKDYRERFRNEIRAAASLNHPGIVQIYDYGNVSHEAAAASGLEILAESPYFVMEFADGGSLDEMNSEMGWERLYDMLVGLLEALGHAHAKGIVHRDLKPSNLMLGTDATGREQFKITDFGLAFDHRYALEGDPSGEQTVGTPKYMAPEQVRSRWRDTGPWTDLYALGCTTWRIVTGDTPYDGYTLLEIAQKHLQKPLPAFEPLIEVPEAFESWLARLLEKHPHDRFRCAPDAMWTLMNLPGAPSETSTTEPTIDAAPTVPKAHVTKPLERAASDSQIEGESDLRAPEPMVALGPDATEMPEVATETADRERPPVPAEWRQRRMGTQPSVTAGRELVALQEIPAVGREEERDRLWEALRETAESGEARGVLLHGDAGVGKSRLARWLLERARELGAATGAVAEHDEQAPPADGLAGAVADYTNASELGRERLIDRLERWYRARGVEHDEEWRAMTELLASGASPTPDDDIVAADIDGAADRADREKSVETVGHEPTEPAGASGECSRGPADPTDGGASPKPKRFSSLEEVRALIRRFLAYATRERPLVFQLDDLHDGPEALRFLRYVLSAAHAEGLPVLFVGTFRDDPLDERPTAAELVDELADLERVDTLEVGPMSERGMLELVEEFLHLTSKAARRVVDRASGNPLFAVELVRDWIDRDVLEPTERGFALADDGERAVPDNIDEVWQRRLDEVLGDADDQTREALWVAAALGEEIDTSEWRAACNELDVRRPGVLPEMLLRDGLLEETDRAVRFAHSALRETLLADAHAEGRLEEIHCACAEAADPDLDDPDCAERYARHLVAAGEPLEALDPLLRAVETLSARQRYHRADALFDTARELAAEVDLADHTALAARYHHVHGRLAAVVDAEMERAARLLDRAVELAEEAGDSHIRAVALCGRASVAQRQGDYERQRELAREAMETRPGDDPTVLLRARFWLGLAAERRGDFEGAAATYREAFRESEAIRLEPKRIEVGHRRGCALKYAGRLEEAESQIREALSLARQISHTRMAGQCCNELAETAKRAGDLDRAERWYERAETFARLNDSPGSFHQFLGRIQVALARGRPEHARSRLEAVRRFTEGRADGYFDIAFQVLTARASAMDADIDSLEAAIERLEEQLARRDRTFKTVVDDVRAAVEAADELDRPDLRTRLNEIARSLDPRATETTSETPAQSPAES